MSTPERREELLTVVDAAQRAAGVVAARHRGDREGAAALMASFEDVSSLAGGSLLVAELALGLYQQASGHMDTCVRELCLRMESSVRRS